MSVLSCSRGGCENIMCDRYSYRYGYICNECFSEMVALRPESIADFMATERPDPVIASLDRIYEEEFPIQGECPDE